MMLAGLTIVVSIAIAVGAEGVDDPLVFAPYADMYDWSPIDALLQQQIEFDA